MSRAILLEVRLFLVSAAFGIAVAVAYDVLRIFRRLIRHGVWWVALEDLLFFFTVSLLVFSMIFAENDGTIRFFSLGSLGLGALLYYQSVSRYLVRFFVWLIGFPFRFLAAAARWWGRQIRKAVGKMARLMKKA